jgi:MoxR-like ATPase
MKVEEHRIITKEEAQQMRLETDLRKCTDNYRRAIGIPIVDQVRGSAPWVGTRAAIDLVVMCTFSANSQIFLLEGPQGAGKTRLLEGLSYAIAVDTDGKPVNYALFSVAEETKVRDLLGMELFDKVKNLPFIDWSVVFSGHVIHIDEVTRATTQFSNGLLQLLQKKGATIKGEYKALQPVHIFGMTCNPEGYLGTRPQPLAFWDRLGGCAWIPHLNGNERKELLSKDCYSDPEIGNHVEPVITLGQISAIRDQVRRIVLPERCIEYITRLTTAFDVDSDEFDQLHSRKEAEKTAIVDGKGAKTIWDAAELRKVLPTMGAGLSVRPDLAMVQLLKSWLFCNVDLDDPVAIGQKVTDDVIQYIFRLAAWKRVNIISNRLTKVQLINMVIDRTKKT